jgi:SAC3 family protein LENG8/THP3
MSQFYYSSDSYTMHPQSLQQNPAAYQQLPNQYQQQLQQRQLQQQQQQQAMYYQQPSYTSVVQQGSAAWQNAVKQHGQSHMNGDSNGSRYHQQSADGQQYSYATQQQQSVVSPAASTAPSAAVSKPVVADSKKAHKSRFSPAVADSSKPAVVVAPKSDKNDSTGKSSAGESAMPDNWPTSLKNFVTRSFGLCRTDGDRMNISQALEKLINKVAFDGRITTHKWELEDVSACVIPVTATPRAASADVSVASKAAPTAARNVAVAQSGSGSGSGSGPNRQKAASNGADNNSNNNSNSSHSGSHYGSSSSGGHAAPVDYGSSVSNSSRLPRSPLPSPHLQAGNDKKRKNRWESESNGSNGDSASYYNVAKQPKKGESKYKPQSTSFADSNEDGYGAVSLNNVVEKAKGTNQIIERPATKAEQAMREKRASRFKETEDTTEAVSSSNRVSSLQSQSQIQFGSKNKQKKRIVENTYYSSSSSQNPSVSSSGEFDFESLIVIGTCQKLEKDYFRLTSAPIPSTVRPEDVLREALMLLKKKWESSSVEYVYMCSQFKSIRQDLTVQHIQNGESFEQCLFSVLFYSLAYYSRHLSV